MQIVVHMLDERTVIHARGTLSTGKTTLARLLHNHLKAIYMVGLIRRWDTKNRAIENLVEDAIN